MAAAGAAAPAPFKPAICNGGRPAPETIRIAVVKLGSVMLACFHDGYYYTGVVEDMKDASKSEIAQIKIAWDDGDPSSWVGIDKVVLAYRHPLPTELAARTPVLALFSGLCKTAGVDEGGEEHEADVWFPAIVLRQKAVDSDGDPMYELAWEDGADKFVAGAHQLRTFLSNPSTPLRLRHANSAPKKAAAASSQRAIGSEASESDVESRPAEGFAVDLLRRSGRSGSSDHALAERADPSDTKLLREAMTELRRVWRGREPGSDWLVEADAGGVPGLFVCNDFVNAQEVEALRTLMGAHRQWAHCHFGMSGRLGELASVVQRIDFGPSAGETGHGGGVMSVSPMWRLGSLRAEMVMMVSDRLKHVFREQHLWKAVQPDVLQLTKLRCGQQLTNSFDRRERWQEGIASVVWSELPCEGDLRGETWSLVMERGAKKDKLTATMHMQPGCAYVLTGAAQGSTRQCEKHTVGHNLCACCWSHGVRMNSASTLSHQSMTMRVQAEDSDDESESEENESAGADPNAAA